MHRRKPNDVPAMRAFIGIIINMPRWQALDRGLVEHAELQPGHADVPASVHAEHVQTSLAVFPHVGL